MLERGASGRQSRAGYRFFARKMRKVSAERLDAREIRILEGLSWVLVMVVTLHALLDLPPDLRITRLRRPGVFDASTSPHNRP